MQEVTIKLPEVDPKLDPRSPDFDVEAWRKAIAKRPIYKERMEALRKRIANLYATTARAEADAALGEILTEHLADTINACIEDSEVISAKLEPIVRAVLDDLLAGKFDDDDAETAALVPTLPHLPGFVPDRYMWPIDKMTARMVGLPIDGATNETEVIKAAGKKPAIFTRFILSYGEDELSSQLPEVYGGTWTQRDREVESAYFTLSEYGVDMFTPEMVFRTLYGRADSAKPTAQQIGAMTRTLEKHRSMRAAIDCKDEFVRRGLAPDKAYFNEPLLMVRELVVESGGKKKRAYCFVAPPIRLTYIKSLRQIADVPRELLDIKTLDKEGRPTPRGISLTEPRLFVRNELLRRIEGMKNPNNKIRQKTIMLESYTDGEGYHRGLYEIAGYKEPTKQKADEIRSFARDALAYWQAKGYIKGFAFEKKGKLITKIRIDP